MSTALDSWALFLCDFSSNTRRVLSLVAALRYSSRVGTHSPLASLWALILANGVSSMTMSPILASWNTTRWSSEVSHTSNSEPYIPMESAFTSERIEFWAEPSVVQ